MPHRGTRPKVICLDEWVLVVKHLSIKIFVALLACLAVGLPTVPALSVSDAEYRYMVTVPDYGKSFMSVNEEFNQVWAEA